MLQGLVILLKKLITSHLPYNIVELIDGTGGVIIMSNKNMSAEKSYNLIKKNVKKKYKTMTTLIKYLIQKSATQNVTISEKGASHSYILLGYPMQSQDRKHAKFSGVFIYQDLKTIEDTNNAITIIILITAIVFLIVSTIFAFFYLIVSLSHLEN